MKVISLFAGFFLLDLWLSGTEALINKQYLSPTIHKLSTKTFEEKNYANSKYEAFEVHDNYEHSKGNGKHKSSYTLKSDKKYWPSQKTSADFPLDNFSYLHSNQRIIAQHESIESNSPDSFLHATSNKQQNLKQFQNQPHAVNNLPPNFKIQKIVSEYQPIQQYKHKSSETSDFDNVVSFDHSDSLSLQQHGSPQSSGQSLHDLISNVASGSLGYLSSHQHISTKLKPIADRKHNSKKTVNESLRKVEFKGPGYLPPCKENNAEQQSKPFRPSTPFNEPDSSPIGELQKITSSTLPPQNQHIQFSYEPNQFFKDPNNSPPLDSNNHIQGYQQELQPLPTGYDFKKPPNAEQAIEELHKLPEESDKSFERPDYILSSISNHIQEYQEQLQSLPLGYDFQKPPNAEQAIEELHKLPEELSISQIQSTGLEKSSSYESNKSLKDSSYLSPLLDNNILEFQQELNSLPLGYDGDEKPPNAKQAIEELHKLPEELAINLLKAEQTTSPFNEHDNSYETNQAHITKNGDTLKLTALQDAQIKEIVQNHQSQTYQESDQNSIFQSLNQRQSKQLSESLKQECNDVNYVLSSKAPEPFQDEYLIPATGPQAFKGSEYLPPTAGSQALEGSEYFPPATESQEFKGPEYLPPTTGSQTFKGSEYLPPATESQEFKGPEYLPPTAGSQTFKGSEYFPPATGSLEFKGPDYLPPTTASKALKGSEYFPPTTGSQGFKGSEYLPPTTGSLEFKSPDYLPPTESKALKFSEYLPPVTGSETFKGPNYLPPTTGSQAIKGSEYLPPTTRLQSFKGSEYLPPPTGSQEFKGPDYLPPTTESQSFKGPEYLPPTTGTQSFKGSEYLPPTTGSKAFKGSEYLPPPTGSLELKGAEYLPPPTGSKEFKGPDYLPPTTESQSFKGPEYLPPTTGMQSFKGSEYLPPVTGSETFKGPNYLPPTTGSQAIKGSEYLPPTTRLQPFKGSEYLPPPTGSHEFKGPDYLPPTTESQSFKGPEYLPPTTGTQSFKGSEYLPPTTGSKAFKGSEYLPPPTGSLELKGAEYLPPPTGSQEFKGPDYLPPTTESQSFKGPEYLPPTTGMQSFKGSEYLPPTTGSKAFKGSEYLPPTTGSKAFKGSEYFTPTTGSQEFRGSEYLPPVTEYLNPFDISHESEVFKGPDYLPPAADSQSYTGSDHSTPVKKTASQTLSSYVGNVKPYDRYGNQRIFFENDLPTIKRVKQSIQTAESNANSQTTLEQRYLPLRTKRNPEAKTKTDTKTK